MKPEDQNPLSAEDAFVGELRRLSPRAPSPEVRARIFRPRWTRIFREPTWAAAVVVFGLGLAAAIFPVHSSAPRRVWLDDTLIETRSSQGVLETFEKRYQLVARNWE